MLSWDLIQNYLTKSGFSYLSHSKGALFIGTNPDKNIPTERGLLPGAGSVVTFVETATQTKPVYIGKPKAIIMERAIAHLGVEKEQVIMVGDNYETDIQSGIQNGIDSLLVTSGFTPKSAVPTLPTPPTYVVDSLDEWTFEYDEVEIAFKGNT